MVLVLWSPVVVPLFPKLVQSWMSHSSSGIADFACIFGLYIAVTILVMLWGKRIRGYEYPLKQYGLDLMSMQKVWIQPMSICLTNIYLCIACHIPLSHARVSVSVGACGIIVQIFSMCGGKGSCYTRIVLCRRIY